MSHLSLANALKDFGGGPAYPAEAFPMPADLALPHDELPELPPMPDVEPVDVDALVAEAVAAAVAQAEATLSERLTGEHAEALHAEQQRHQEEITDLQKRLGDQAALKILTRCREMEERLVELTSAVAARILGAVLTDDIRDRSIDRLAEVIREAMHDAEAVRIRVRGNLPLFETLKERLPEHANQLDFMESPDFDLAVSIDDSVYETRLAEWSLALSETLA